MIELHAMAGIADICSGDDLGREIANALTACGRHLDDSDILVVAHKIISKAEGRVVQLAAVTPSERALELAKRTGKDSRKVELVLRESKNIVRVRDADEHGEGVIIARHRLGFVSANASIDESNVGESGTIILLPENPDASAMYLQQRLHELTGARPGIVISDTFGRPWRLGQVNIAIGLAGVPALTDLTKTCDAWGQALKVTKPALADELAAASGLLMAKQDKTPVILFRGVHWQREHSSIEHLLRSPQEDLFA